MNAEEFVSQITNDHSEFFQELLSLLEDHRVLYCVIGGLAVNAYTEPVVSLDLDLVIVTDKLEELMRILESRFKVTRFPRSINVSSAGSDLRVQIQTDPRYQAFLARSSRKNVLGHELQVAAIEDVLQGKIWAYADPERRPSKRQKDLADILRLIETDLQLKDVLPDDLRSEISRLGF